MSRPGLEVATGNLEKMITEEPPVESVIRLALSPFLGKAVEVVTGDGGDDDKLHQGQLSRLVTTQIFVGYVGEHQWLRAVVLDDGSDGENEIPCEHIRSIRLA